MRRSFMRLTSADEALTSQPCPRGRAGSIARLTDHAPMVSRRRRCWENVRENLLAADAVGNAADSDGFVDAMLSKIWCQTPG